MKKIIIEVGGMTFTAELNKSHTAKAIWKALPLDGQVHRWGDEIYFDIPVEHKLEADAREEVELGTLAYWPTGCTFCMFFGRTPVSFGNKPRAYSAVNVIGKIEEDSRELRSVESGVSILIKRLE